VITGGALEALNLSLQVLTRPGDAVAIEAPAFYGCLQARRECSPEGGGDPDESRDGRRPWARSRRQSSGHAIRACWLMTTFQNPLGATMPEAKKLALVALLEKHDVR